MFSYPRSAFFIFCGDYRPKIKGENPGLSIGDIAKKLGEMWNSSSAEVKQPYEKKAAKLKEKYDKVRLSTKFGIWHEVFCLWVLMNVKLSSRILRHTAQRVLQACPNQIPVMTTMRKRMRKRRMRTMMRKRTMNRYGWSLDFFFHAINPVVHDPHLQT